MNVNELLDTIEDALEEGANVPLSGGMPFAALVRASMVLSSLAVTVCGFLFEITNGMPPVFLFFSP